MDYESEIEMRREHLLKSLALVSMKVRENEFEDALYWLDSARIFINAIARDVKDNADS